MVCQYVSMSICYNGFRIGFYLLPYPLPQTHAHRLIIARGQYMYKIGPTWMIEFLVEIFIYQLPYPRLPSLSDASILMQRSVLDRWSVPAPPTALDWGGNSLAGPLHPPPRHHQPPGPSSSGPWHPPSSARNHAQPAFIVSFVSLKVWRQVLCLPLFWGHWHLSKVSQSKTQGSSSASFLLW